MTDKSITNPKYIERKEVDYVTTNEQYAHNLTMYAKRKYVLYPPTKAIYEYIRNSCIDIVKNHPQYPKFNWKPKIADIGCGGGFGTYILSHEADFAWGIDISPTSIHWAKTIYEKHKNKYYYSSQITFDVIDVRDEPREIQYFDIVACVELIEHIDDYVKVLDFLKRLCKRHKKTGEIVQPPDATIVYISSPNRNFPKMGQEQAKNNKHVREWTAGELYGILVKHFKHVMLLDHNGEPQELDTKTAVLLYKCEVPL